MEEQVAQKSSELEQYLQRVRELEEMYNQLQEALEEEKQARQDEETVRRLQARLVCRSATTGLYILGLGVLSERSLSNGMETGLPDQLTWLAEVS